MTTNTPADVTGMSDAELVNSLMVKAGAMVLAKLFDDIILKESAKALVEERESELLRRLAAPAPRGEMVSVSREDAEVLQGLAYNAWGAAFDANKGGNDNPYYGVVKRLRAALAGEEGEVVSVSRKHLEQTVAWVWKEPDVWGDDDQAAFNAIMAALADEQHEEHDDE